MHVLLLHAYINTCIHAYTYTYIHAYTHTYMHTNMQTHKQTHTQRQTDRRENWIMNGEERERVALLKYLSGTFHSPHSLTFSSRKQNNKTRPD